MEEVIEELRRIAEALERIAQPLEYIEDTIHKERKEDD